MRDHYFHPLKHVCSLRALHRSAMPEEQRDSQELPAFLSLPGAQEEQQVSPSSPHLTCTAARLPPPRPLRCPVLPGAEGRSPCGRCGISGLLPAHPCPAQGGESLFSAAAGPFPCGREAGSVPLLGRALDGTDGRRCRERALPRAMTLAVPLSPPLPLPCCTPHGPSCPAKAPPGLRGG